MAETQPQRTLLCRYHGIGPGNPGCAACERILRDQDPFYATIMFRRAIEKDDSHWVRKALELGVDPKAILQPVHPHTSYGWSDPLSVARSAEVASILVAAGASLEVRNYGRTPLHALLRSTSLQAQHKHEIIVALLRSGADANAQSGFGSDRPMPLDYAVVESSPFWRRRIGLALLRAGALVAKMYSADGRMLLSRYTNFDQFAANHRRVWVSVIAKCAAIPHDAAGVVASFVSPKGGY